MERFRLNQEPESLKLIVDHFLAGECVLPGLGMMLLFIWEDSSTVLDSIESAALNYA
jgi:hypothetical protein